ncbi:hypothetical protein L1887_02634 [Cichorium endivia]|nr:hypothetical protein L1887_02634 [Cichorium endivia]
MDFKIEDSGFIGRMVWELNPSSCCWIHTSALRVNGMFKNYQEKQEVNSIKASHKTGFVMNMKDFDSQLSKMN